jgi:hypothetical protein
MAEYQIFVCLSQLITSPAARHTRAQAGLSEARTPSDLRAMARMVDCQSFLSPEICPLPAPAPDAHSNLVRHTNTRSTFTAPPYLLEGTVKSSLYLAPKLARSEAWRRLSRNTRK